MHPATVLEHHSVDERLHKIPDPDYRNHLAYGKLFGKPTLVARIAALRQLLPYLRAEAVKTLRHDKTKTPRKEVRISALARDLIRDGAVAVRLTPDEIERIRAGAGPYIRALEERRARTPEGQPRTWADTSQSIPRTAAPELHAYLRDVLKGHGILSAAKGYLGRVVGVKLVDVQINDPGDSHWRDHFADAGLPDPATAYMHIDSVQRLKCMIYLCEVAPKTGPFRYVLGTNNIRMGRLEQIVRRANDVSRLDRCDRQTRELFSALPRVLQKKSEFGNDLIDSSPEAAAVLALERAFTSDRGNLVLFDNKGIHRGGMVVEGRRIVLQVSLGRV